MDNSLYSSNHFELYFEFATILFNLVYVSKLTRTLNYCISFSPDHCQIQDLSMKRVLSRGHEFRGLYILETMVPKSVFCSRVVTPFKLHCL